MVGFTMFQQVDATFLTANNETKKTILVEYQSYF